MSSCLHFFYEILQKNRRSRVADALFFSTFFAQICRRIEELGRIGDLGHFNLDIDIDIDHFNLLLTNSVKELDSFNNNQYEVFFDNCRFFVSMVEFVELVL
ncbi:hypothetical protein HYC85_005879 [Camellia sinensis]|uniref:Uncharacterized protein n=1 Tax=Camellia sinensis TaxID=4442 RepID=A0A7J7I2K2_CAMSI|nr:hypothetical protein HYC85_005879 [Camellia sinensis]